jgi:hypothetical protein
MLGSGSMLNCEMPSDLMQKIRSMCSYFEQAVQAEAQRRRLIPALFPALFPCNILCIADKQNVHVVFSNQNAGGLPVQTWLDRRTLGPFPIEEVISAGVAQHGLINPSNLSFSLHLLEMPEGTQRGTASGLAMQYVEEIFKAATRPRAITGYEGLQPLLDRFTKDHPDFQKNVLIVMRFRGNPQFLEIHQAIKTGLTKYDLNGLRVDDKSYPPDGDLWNNIWCLHDGLQIRCLCF